MPETAASTRVRDALDQAAEQLRAAGCEAPRLDAELLMAFALGVERARLVIDAQELLSDDAVCHFEALLARRARREPVAYILGRKEFRRISLSVDRRVLIPRPETELLVEAALALPRGTRVVDVGTGSGAVALAIKHERPDLRVVGTEWSDDALEVARSNAARLGLEVRFARADLLEGIECEAVLANLPYVAAGDQLAPEIIGYEPTEALFAGDDGLSVIRRLVAELPAKVSYVALEVGAGQADEVARLLGGAGFASVERICDLAGHERVLIGRR
ncbi:MAG: peptide chain release factor N(5)-glutamine methyltransferase [Solirubrobacterales bacterium]|nr:peptide chain release factor N(5)-glutamine methyltransferase [Solirubrobacterales bacterium]